MTVTDFLIFLILESKLGIVDRLHGSFVGVNDDIGVYCVENRKLSNSRAHCKDRVSRFLRLCEKANIRGLNDRGGAEVCNCYCCGAADLR